MIILVKPKIARIKRKKKLYSIKLNVQYIRTVSRSKVKLTSSKFIINKI